MRIAKSWGEQWRINDFWERGGIGLGAGAPIATCLVSSSVIAQETQQEMRYPNVTSLYFATPLAFNPFTADPIKASHFAILV